MLLDDVVEEVDDVGPACWCPKDVEFVVFSSSAQEGSTRKTKSRETMVTFLTICTAIICCNVQMVMHTWKYFGITYINIASTFVLYARE